MRTAILIVVIMLVLSAAVAAEDPSTFDPRYGVVATDSSGWGDPVMPVQGPQYFDQLGTAWWYNYTQSVMSYQVGGLSLFWPGYQRLYMFWKATATTSDTDIQNFARAAKAADPNHTIWWAMSNEPNDRGQANQTGASFAAIYLKYHKNLRIGDPTCKIMGCGILNWTFQSDSNYQMGKAWYEEFRNAWAANPDCVAYSQSVNGTNYPPQDGFCLHPYDLRGQSPTPYAPDDWRWCRDQMIACHNDLETYPETQGLKIWNTEFGSLMAPSVAQAADMESGLVLWMREQPWVERWFLFYTHCDKNACLPTLQLFDNNGNITQLGKLYRDLSKLPANESFYHYPYSAKWDTASAYVRSGWTQAAGINEACNDPGYKLYLVQNTAYTANTMRGRTFTPDNGYIYKLRFNYLTNYDNTKCFLAMDTPNQQGKWQMDSFGSNTDYVEVDLSDNPVPYVSFGLLNKSGYTYANATGEWQAVIANLMLFTCPAPPAVTDEGTLVTDPHKLSFSWSAATGGRQPIVEYEYAIGTTSKGTDILSWTSAGPATSATRDDLNLQNNVSYYVSVRAKDSLGHVGAVGCSDGITKAAIAPNPSDAKKMQMGDYLVLKDMVVSAAFPGRFYVQREDGSAGIGVVSSSVVSVGDRVTVGGKLQSIDGEAVIVGDVLSQTPGSAPQPVAMNAKASGGGALGLQPAVVNQAADNADAFGLSNVGLLVRLSGKVTAVDIANSVFYLDDGSNLSDGSGCNGVRTDLMRLPLPQAGTNAKITGICSATMINGKPARFIRPRGVDDVSFDQLAVNLLSNSSFESGSFTSWTNISAQGAVITGTDSYGISPYDGNCFFESAMTGTLKPGHKYQVVTLTPGSYCAFVASRVLHNGNTSTAAKNRIGIDPLGGTNPNAATIVWSDWDVQEGSNVSEWRIIQTPAVNVTGTKATVFLKYYQEQPAGLHVNCFDGAYLLKLNQ